MSSLLGDTQGKSRSNSGLSAGGLKAINKNLVDTQGLRGFNNSFIQQVTEALRTGGIGAQIPIIGQAVSSANQAQSQALQGTENSLASSGLTRSPYGQSILAQQRQQGAQAIGRIPTDYAQQFIGQGPSFSGGLLQAILGSLNKSSSRSGPYNT